MSSIRCATFWATVWRACARRSGAHTPRVDVVAAANEARAARADLVLTVGGGSVTDAAKMVGLCLGNDVST
jgi:maleylacetate reductase